MFLGEGRALVKLEGRLCEVVLEACCLLEGAGREADPVFVLVVFCVVVDDDGC